MRPTATQPTPTIEIRDLTRRFGEVTALDRVSITIQPGEFFSLLGPSGCGKTTLLRILAGLDHPDSGSLAIDGSDATRTPAHRRPVNTVFQSYALFPHLDVHNNVAFGLRMKKLPAAEIDRRVADLLELVQITPLARRYPHQLSGGQKQRTALARALVNQPRVLLLDEPLAALDLQLRKQIQSELRSLQRRLNTTFVYVTHDQEEALTLSDRIAVLRDGRIEQIDDARTLYERPRTRFVTRFLGSGSLIDARIRERFPDGFLADTAVGPLHVASPAPDRNAVTLAIRPEKVRLLPQPDPRSPNQIHALVEQRTYVGAETHFDLRAGSQSLRAETMNSLADAAARNPAPGDTVTLELPPAALVVLDD